MLEVSYFIVNVDFHRHNFAMVTLRMKVMCVSMRTEFHLDMLPSDVVFISLVNIQICFTFNIHCPSVSGHIH